MTSTDEQQASLHRQLLAVRGQCDVLASTAVPAVAAVYARLADAKAELAGQLAQELDEVAVQRRGVNDGRRTERLQRRWLAMTAGRVPTGVSAASSADVAVLVAAEDRLVHRCEQVLASEPSPAVRQALRRYLPKVEACRIEMGRLHVLASGPVRRKRRIPALLRGERRS